MTGFSKEMQDALKADAEKLSALTGEEHTIEFFDDDDGCPNCDGSGFIYDCFDGLCLDADAGCDKCEIRCDLCNPRKLKEATNDPA